MGWGTKVRRTGAISDEPAKNRGSGCLILFGLFFAVFGGFFVVMFFALPLWHVMQARSWIQVPCTIVTSKVGESSGDNGPTYRVEMTFRYRFGGGGAESDPAAQEYVGGSYDLSGGISSSGRSGKQEVIDRLPPGTATTCWVDPGNPSRAVIERGTTGVMWAGAFTLIFPIIGIAIVFFTVRARLRQKHAGISDQAGARLAAPPTPDLPMTAGGRVVLKPVQSPLAKFVVMVVFAGIWNGITWTAILLAVLPSWQRDQGEWFPTIFLGVFALIGLAVLGGVVYQLLALGNPRLRLTVDRTVVRPGDELDLEWECTGNVRRLRRLRLLLEGREEATYKRGTSTATDTHVFASIAIADLDDAMRMASGRAVLRIPASAMPTFVADHNKILWRLAVRGDIPRWPDVSDDYDLTVVPRHA